MTASSGEPVPSLEPAGWILYDGDCGFCYRWVHLWKDVVERRGFVLKSLQSAFADGSLSIPRDQLLEDILVLTADRRLVAGADAYLFVARRIWWALPFYALFSRPGFHGILEQGSRWFNRNRYHFSRHCPLPPRPSSPPPFERHD